MKCNHSSLVRVEEREVIQKHYYSVHFSSSSPCSDVKPDNELKNMILVQKCLAQTFIQNAKKVIDCSDWYTEDKATYACVVSFFINWQSSYNVNWIPRANKKSLLESLVRDILILINWQIVFYHLDQPIYSLPNWIHVNWCLIQIDFVYIIKLSHLSSFKMFLKFIMVIINNLMITNLYLK